MLRLAIACVLGAWLCACQGRLTDRADGSVGGIGGVGGVGGIAGVGGTAGTRDAANDAQQDAAVGDAGFDAAALDSGVDASIALPVWPRPCADIYDPNLVPTFELSFTPQEWSALERDCDDNVQQYRPATFRYGSEEHAVMVRLKGNWSWTCDKMQFVISFNEVDPNGRFHGVRKLVLDAPWYDRTLLHERLAFPIFAARGLPYSCANSARLAINGSYYGVFTNAERLDKEYLQRHFAEADGNLYQAGVELKTNEDINDTSDIQALNAAQTVAEIDALMDLDQAVAEWATEAMLPALDNYWAGVEINYYLYNHPSRGFLYLPYDMDIIFGDSARRNGDLIWPDAVDADPLTYEHNEWRKEPLLMRVLSDATWCRRFVDELVLARAAYSPAQLSAQVDAWSEQIAQAVADDPNKTFTTAEHNAAIASLKQFFAQRAAVVDQWLQAGPTCPPQW